MVIVTNANKALKDESFLHDAEGTERNHWSKHSHQMKISGVISKPPYRKLIYMVKVK